MAKINRKKLLLHLTFTISILTNIYFLNIPKKENINLNKSSNLLAYYIENDNQEYELTSSKSFPKEGYILNTEKSSCKNGSILTQNESTKTLNMKAHNKDECTLYFEKEFSSEKTLQKLGLSSQDSKNVNFARSALTDETKDGLFSLEDDYGLSYYFRGAVENNYIKFGTNATGEEMWWRIIRINGDGSIRILYDGTQGWANGVEDTN